MVSKSDGALMREWRVADQLVQGIVMSRMTARLVAFVASLFVTAASPAYAIDRVQEHTLQFGGTARTYLVYAPKRIEQRDAALVIALHGNGGSGENFLKQGKWVKKAHAEGIILVAPDGVPERDDKPARFRDNRRSWNAGPETGSSAQLRGIDDVNFIRALIAEVKRDHRIDTQRIYVTGFSNGAGMAFRVGAELSDIIAAIAPVSNAMLLPVEELKKPVSLLLIWGSEDPLNPIDGGVVKRSGDKRTRPSAAASWTRWAELLGCNKTPHASKLSPAVEKQTYASCRDGSAAEFIKVDGMGHQWPGGEVVMRVVSGPGSSALDATDVIWTFFQAHSR